MISSMPTTAGSNSTVPVSIARLTEALFTPGSLFSTFSISPEQLAQCMPVRTSVTLPACAAGAAASSGMAV